jgi:predicted nucleic acid-binding protein
VKFWDTSGLVPLLVEEPTTDAMRAHLAEDRQVIVWMLSSVELLSTLGRLGRQTSELADLLPGARADAMQLFARWSAVIDVPAVARRAERLVGVHPLAAADAMQLGAALLASGDRPESLPFVTLDSVLARAARLEGFLVVGA